MVIAPCVCCDKHKAMRVPKLYVLVVFYLKSRFFDVCFVDQVQCIGLMLLF